MLNRAYNSLKSQKSHVILHDITILNKNGKTTKYCYGQLSEFKAVRIWFEAVR